MQHNGARFLIPLACFDAFGTILQAFAALAEADREYSLTKAERVKKKTERLNAEANLRKREKHNVRVGRFREKGGPADPDLPWWYIDDSLVHQGPFEREMMRGWFEDGAITEGRKLSQSESGPYKVLNKHFNVLELAFSDTWCVTQRPFREDYLELTVKELQTELELVGPAADWIENRTDEIESYVESMKTEQKAAKRTLKHTEGGSETHCRKNKI